MIIESIYVEGYIPLLINNIKSIEINFTSDLLLLLGSNGSGKSALARQLNPFPPTPADYDDGGIKKIKISHNNNSYELISIMKGSGRHTLIKNNVIIHEGANSTLHREIVINEFGYTPIIHKLLVGELRFTEMSPAMRKEILTLINPLQLDWAISLHSVTKDCIKDTAVILKHTVNKNSDLKTKLLSLNIPDDLEEKQVEREIKLNTLLPFSLQKSTPVDETNFNIENDLKQLNILKAKALKIDNSRTPNDSIKSKEDLIDYINSIAGNISATQYIISNLSEEIESLSGVTNSLISNTLSIEEIEERLHSIIAEISNISCIPMVNSNHTQYLNTLVDVDHEFEVIFDMSKDIVLYSRNEREKIQSEHTKLSTRLIQIKNYINKVTLDLTHLDEHNEDINCPQCKFKFNLNGLTVDSSRDKLKSSIDKATIDLEATDPLLKDLAIQLEHVKLYETIILKYTNIKKNFFMPYEFWSSIDGNLENYITTPINYLRLSTQWQINLNQSKKLLELQEELNSYKNALNIFEKYGSSLDSKLDNLNIQIENEISKKNELENSLNKARSLLRNYDNLNSLLLHSETIFQSLNQNFNNLVDSTIISDAKERTNILYNELANDKQIINQYQNLTNTITDLDEEFQVLSKKHKASQILEEILSPSKGLIAEQMLDFITSYTDQINIIIEQLFEYSLTIEPCNIENGNLDYYFPLTAKNRTIKDINLASDGQADLINFAFIIVMREYLNLNDYPIFLDELGRTFDTAHKTKLLYYIKNVLPNLSSQVVMINHFTEFYGGLPNNQTIVLDSTNIVVPSYYNENVTINYLH